MISRQFGLGYYTWQSRRLLEYAGADVGMLSIGADGLVTARLVDYVGRRVSRWLPRAAG
jgi:NitT/TauT family transport system permease protein